jgi:major membrane immunogen (membrane-anchored lipoprotein)
VMKSHLAIAVTVAVALLLSGCDAFDTMKEGFAHSQAVSDQLEKSVGVKAFVGFNWNNGSLTSVSVTFQSIPPNAQLQDIVGKATQAVLHEFNQKPKQIVVGFTIQQ